MGDGAIGHTIQIHHSQRSKKNMPCCQNRLWRLICCFYRKNLGSKKRAHCPTWQLTLPTFLEISILFRHQSMCIINLFFRIQLNRILFFNQFKFISLFMALNNVHYTSLLLVFSISCNKNFPSP